MKICSKCSYANLDDSRYCEKCGAQFASNKKKIIIISALVVLLIIGIVYVISVIKPKVPQEPKGKFTVRENVLQKIIDAKVLRVAVESEALPFNWIDEETHQPTGFEYDLISLVAEKMGIPKVEMVWTSNYEDIPNMISQERDQADIFMGGYVASANIPNVVWSNSYYEENGYCLIVQNGSAIKNLKDLNGKKIGVYNEDAAEEFVKENVTSPAGIYRFEDIDEDGTWMMTHLIEPLANKKKREWVDAVVYDYVFAKEEIKVSDGQLKIVAFNLNKLPYQIGLPKNNYKLQKSINSSLKQVMDSPVYAQLVKKYLDFDASNVSLPSLGSNVRKHTVVANETLGSIAQMELGSSLRWNDIWEANKSRIPNPNLIHINDELIIP